MARRKPEPKLVPTLIEFECVTPRGFRDFKRIAAETAGLPFGRPYAGPSPEGACFTWILPDLPERCVKVYGGGSVYTLAGVLESCGGSITRSTPAPSDPCPLCGEDRNHHSQYIRGGHVC